jgi:hypothetical protein
MSEFDNAKRTPGIWAAIQKLRADITHELSGRWKHETEEQAAGYHATRDSVIAESDRAAEIVAHHEALMVADLRAAGLDTYADAVEHGDYTGITV